MEAAAGAALEATYAGRNRYEGTYRPPERSRDRWPIAEVDDQLGPKLTDARIRKALTPGRTSAEVAIGSVFLCRALLVNLRTHTLGNRATVAPALM